MPSAPVRMQTSLEGDLLRGDRRAVERVGLGVGESGREPGDDGAGNRRRRPAIPALEPQLAGVGLHALGHDEAGLDVEGSYPAAAVFDGKDADEAVERPFGHGVAESPPALSRPRAWIADRDRSGEFDDRAGPLLTPARQTSLDE